MREQFMMYGVLSPDPNLGRYKYTTVRFPCQCLGGAILVPSFCLARLVKRDYTVRNDPRGKYSLRGAGSVIMQWLYMSDIRRFHVMRNECTRFFCRF